jgi:hypothetical protein
MLADFAIRLAGGLAAVLATTSWRVVPLQFFRAQCQVILGLGVLATMVAVSSSSGTIVFALALTVAILSFIASVVWGLGLPSLGNPLVILTAIASGVLLVITVDDPTSTSGLINGLSRLASAFLMGATLNAMLLGHHYLTAPAMSITPLVRYVQFMIAGLGVRTVLATIVLGLWWSGGMAGQSISPLFLAIRWGMGIFGVAVATYLTWETVKIRSTQSATGILYIGMTLVLFGELSSLILARESHLLI